MKYNPGDILKWNDNTKDKRVFMITGSYTYIGGGTHERYRLRMLDRLDRETNFSYSMIHKNCTLVQKAKR